MVLSVFVVYTGLIRFWGLTESSEARYAEISREMVTTVDYLHPQLLGIFHYHKPPLTYYITAIGFKIFGINEFGARFFLGIALILQLFLVFEISKLFHQNEKTAFTAAVIYLSFPITLVAAFNLTTDAYLVTVILAAVYFWLQRSRTKNHIYSYGFYIFCGLGFLLKGPVVFLPILIFLSVYKIFIKSKTIFGFQDFIGICLMLIISSSWYLLIIKDTPALWEYFTQHQLADRIADAKSFHRSKPFWYYFAFAPLISLPWSGFFAYRYALQITRKNWKAHITNVLLIVFISIICIYSLFSSKLVLYILPAFPFLAILGAKYYVGISQEKLLWFSRVFFVLYAIVALSLVICPFLNLFDLNFQYLILLLVLIGIALFFILKNYRNDIKQRIIMLSICFTFFLMGAFALFSLENPLKINSVKEIVAFVQKEKKQKINHFIVYNYLLPSASFYLEKDIITISDGYVKSKRETGFQKNDSYRSNYINLRNDGTTADLDKAFEGINNVLLTKSKFLKKNQLANYIARFEHQKEFGEWLVFY